MENETNTGATLSAEPAAGVSAEQAQQEIQTLRGDKDFTSKLFAKDAQANARWTELHAAAYPEPTSDSAATQQTTQPAQATQEVDPAFAPPSTPGGYKFDKLPAGVEHDLQQETFVREVFHAAGIPQGTANQIHKLYSEAILSPPDATQMEVAHQRGMIQLEKTHGANASEVIRIARQEVAAAAARPGGERLIQMLEQSGLGNHPYLITSLYLNAVAKGRAKGRA